VSTNHGVQTLVPQKEKKRKNFKKETSHIHIPFILIFTSLLRGDSKMSAKGRKQKACLLK
jgi:hypothetical protein